MTIADPAPGAAAAFRAEPVPVATVNGLRTFVAEQPGPLRASLLVRVGSADETFVRHGITHMVEHLALHGEMTGAVEVNGHVSWTTMELQASGDPREIGAFLNRVTGRLRSLPRDRFAAERKILHAEASQRQSNLHDHLLAYRFGATSYGLAVMGDVGLDQLQFEDVQAWAHRYAVNGNAVLFLTGAPPSNFTMPLLRGPAFPAPDPTRNLVSPLPGWIPGPPDAIVLHGVVRRSTAARVMTEILRNRLLEALRERQPLSYSPTVSYEPLTAEHALIAVTADVAEQPVRACDLFLRVFEELATGERAATAGEIERERRLTQQQFGTPAAQVAFTHAAATAVLYGGEPTTPRQLAEELAAVDAAQVEHAIVDVLLDAIVAVPPGVEPPAPWAAAPMCGEPAVTSGERFSPARGQAAREHREAVLGSGALTWVPVDGPTVTVAAPRTAALVRWDNGARMLIGEDGSQIPIEPHQWRDGRRLVEEIDTTFAGAPQLRLQLSDDELARQLEHNRRRIRRAWIWVAVRVAVCLTVLAVLLALKGGITWSFLAPVALSVGWIGRGLGGVTQAYDESLATLPDPEVPGRERAVGGCRRSRTAGLMVRPDG